MAWVEPVGSQLPWQSSPASMTSSASTKTILIDEKGNQIPMYVDVDEHRKFKLIDHAESRPVSIEKATDVCSTLLFGTSATMGRSSICRIRIYHTMPWKRSAGIRFENCSWKFDCFENPHLYTKKRRLPHSTDYFRRSKGPRPLRGATPRVDDPEPNPPIAVSTSSRPRRSEPLLNLPTPIFSPFSRLRVAGRDDVTSKTLFKVGW